MVIYIHSHPQRTAALFDIDREGKTKTKYKRSAKRKLNTNLSE